MAKSVEVKYCAHCGTATRQGAAFCPRCGERFAIVRRRNKSATAIMLSIAGALLFCIVFGILISPYDRQPGGVSEALASTEADHETVIHDDEYCTVRFAELFDYADLYPTEQDLGVGYIRLDIENKCSESVTAVMSELYINDIAVTAMSGRPVEIATSKRSREPFIFNYSALDVDSKEDIERVEFVITFYNSDFASAYVSPTLALPVG